MKRFIIGIDEVGRGALAGPVTVAAVALSGKLNLKNQVLKTQVKNKNLSLRDSKKLSPFQREAFFNFIKRRKIPYIVASVSAGVIDKINISNAANSAAGRAFGRLLKKHKLAAGNCVVCLDGGMYLPRSSDSKPRVLNSITRGDEKIPAIALASIAAKVSRDRLMKKLNRRHPEYGFGDHKGYGTAKHLKALRKYGRSPIHRKSFKVK